MILWVHAITSRLAQQFSQGPTDTVTTGRNWGNAWRAIIVTIVAKKLYCVEWTQYSIRPKWSTCDFMQQMFPGPTRVLGANGISIVSAVFAGLTRWQTDWQTDRPRYSVSSNRRSTQWRSQILLMSMATTSIYWSRRRDRPDQLHQSTAIFSCKTRWVAVYVETQQL